MVSAGYKWSHILLSILMCDHVLGHKKHGCGVNPHKLIEISCPTLPWDPLEARYIRIDHAVYGTYHRPECVNSCCEPDSNDCEQSVDQRNFDSIVSECNMTARWCGVDVSHSDSIEKCPSSSGSQYQAVYYTCVLANGTSAGPSKYEVLHKGLFKLTKYAKQTWQSSNNYWRLQQGWSKWAVDGKDDARWKDWSCTHTKKTYQPWWAVDLGAVRNIVRVGIQNRVESFWRLRNFQIGWSSSSPAVVAPSTNNYNVCATYGPTMEAGEYREFECPAQGRYVIIQLLIKEYLTLCEVKVFGGPPQYQSAHVMGLSSIPSQGMQMDNDLDSDLDNEYSMIGLGAIGTITTLTVVGVGFMILGAAVFVYLRKVRNRDKSFSDGNPSLPESAYTTACPTVTTSSCPLPSSAA